MKWLIIPVCAIVLCSSCTKDRDVSKLRREVDTFLVYNGLLKINEFVAKGSTFINEYGITSDWFEIYNSTGQNIVLESGKWYVTDDLTKPRKYELPTISISAFGYMIVCCDGLNKYEQQIHSNFDLSAAGEQIGVFYINADQSVMPIDTLSYPAMTDKGFSYGRLPNGSNNWTYFAIPTPGAANHY